MTAHLKLYLEDHGQEFLSFTVALDDDGFTGTIVDTQPFQGWVWNGRQLTVNSMKPGRRPVFADRGGAVLNYPIVQVETLAAPGAITLCPRNGMRTVERTGLCHDCTDSACALNPPDAA